MMSILDRPLKYKQIRMGRPMIRFPAKLDELEPNDLIRTEFWDFSNLGLTEIPKEILNHFAQYPMEDELVDALDFSHNNISKIPEELNCTYLEHLDLSYNNIRELPINLNFRVLQSFDLSNNNFTRVPTDAISNAHNLIDLNMDNNQVSKIPLQDMVILSAIDMITLKDNPVEYEYDQKELAAMRIGIMEYEKTARSRFKFRQSNYSDLDLYRVGLDKMDIIHKRFTKLSMYRFSYYENIISYLRYIKQDKRPVEHEIFWDRFNEMIKQFKDITVQNGGDYIEIILNDTTRKKEFDEWLPELFDGCLVD